LFSGPRAGRAAACRNTLPLLRLYFAHHTTCATFCYALFICLPTASHFLRACPHHPALQLPPSFLPLHCGSTHRCRIRPASLLDGTATAPALTRGPCLLTRSIPASRARISCCRSTTGHSCLVAASATIYRNNRHAACLLLDCQRFSPLRSVAAYALCAPLLLTCVPPRPDTCRWRFRTWFYATVAFTACCADAARTMRGTRAPLRTHTPGPRIHACMPRLPFNALLNTALHRLPPGLLRRTDYQYPGSVGCLTDVLRGPTPDYCYHDFMTPYTHTCAPAILAHPRRTPDTALAFTATATAHARCPSGPCHPPLYAWLGSACRAVLLPTC